MPSSGLTPQDVQLVLECLSDVPKSRTSIAEEVFGSTHSHSLRRVSLAVAEARRSGFNIIRAMERDAELGKVYMYRVHPSDWTAYREFVRGKAYTVVSVV